MLFADIFKIYSKNLLRSMSAKEKIYIETNIVEKEIEMKWQKFKNIMIFKDLNFEF